MTRSLLHRHPRWGRRSTTLLTASGPHMTVSPPSLRQAPASPWAWLMYWLMAPAPQDAAPPLNRLPGVRQDFLTAIADIDSEDAEVLRERVRHACSLRELWHARAETFRVVGVAHNETVAEKRLARLNRHFPARAPRSQFAPL